MMNKKKFAVPAYVTAEEIKAIRNRWKLTQKEFAEMIGCSKPTIEIRERVRSILYEQIRKYRYLFAKR